MVLLYSKEYPLVSHYLASALRFIPHCSLLAVLNDGEAFQNVQRAILEPCVPGVLKDRVGDILSLSLMLISSNISQRISHFFFFFFLAVGFVGS